MRKRGATLLGIYMPEVIIITELCLRDVHYNMNTCTSYFSNVIIAFFSFPHFRKHSKTASQFNL